MIQKTLDNSHIRQKSISQDCSTCKTISVSFETYQLLSSLKSNLRKNNGGFHSFNTVIHHLFQQKRKYIQVKAKLDELSLEKAHLLENENSFLKQLLLQQATHSIPVIQNQSPYQSPANYQSLTPPPPSPPPALSKPNQRKFIPPNTGDLKKDYVKEIQQIFTGTPLKPSEIAQTTQPKHINSEVNTFTDSFEIPCIDSISVAKYYQKETEITA